MLTEAEVLPPVFVAVMVNVVFARDLGVPEMIPDDGSRLSPNGSGGATE